MPPVPSTAGAQARRHRFRREDWLARALELLAREGESTLHIDRLAHGLGVTKGSFYWHFRDRADFVRQLATYWEQAYTRVVDEEIARRDVGPRRRLAELARLITERDLGRYDVVMRAWAVHEAEVAAVVQRADGYRMKVVRSLFSAIGFTGEALETRTRVFVTFFSFELGLSSSESRRRRLAALESRIEFFTRR